MQWSEELFCSKQTFVLNEILTLKLTLPPFVEPSQHNEAPISGLSEFPVSQVPLTENNSTCEPGPEVSLMNSTEEPFDKFSFQLQFPFPTSSACPSTPHLFIIIDNTLVNSPSPKIPSVASEHTIRSIP
ncbi:hypothetical protein O181_010150 [Austropuccinia psidii MF-1]|uniref:Uncharacterized protein n=1 Tax=Austropuccinia psidii MF-1 TaxID=1389203 RepID=A0A9Q3BSM7_9BASI|nr:hypothetical protein [Austropuccinia psidii MF-1]